jgi:DNA-binding NtrC family response regulator
MRVVVVDNDVALLRSLEILLCGRGHEVSSFHNPYDACSFIERSASFDALILDYAMPGLNGEEVLQQVRKRLSEDCKIILISGHTDLIEPLDLKAMGIAAFLPKPLDFDRLCKMVGSRDGALPGTGC